MNPTRDTMTVPKVPVLVVEDLCVQYGSVKAVDGVSFALNAGERLGLIGESGSGKTTVATALMRLTRPPGRVVGGRILLEGRDILKMTDGELRQARLKEIALIPQGAMNSLNPVMRLDVQIIDALVSHEGEASKKRLDDRVAEMLRGVGLDPAVAKKYPHQLSGGMKQRAIIAIATCLSPKVVIADEPTSALDVVVQRQVMQTLGKLQMGLGSAVILIGHDMGLIAQFADIVGVMYAGKLVEIGPVERVISNPRHPYTRLLIDSLPSISSKKKIAGIPGLPPVMRDFPPSCSFNARCPYALSRCLVETPVLREVGSLRQTACHLYPLYQELPPLTAINSVGAESRGDRQ